ncbi:MAG: glutathione S-transferase [Polyangiaceae bacterium]|nr:glutathione S-transferase [Polyangiaceae bacterium]
MQPRLYTFRISHFSEKVRWALDHARIPYEERTLVPGAHLPIIRRRARKSSVPLLEHDGNVVQGSSTILDYLENRLGAKTLAIPEAHTTRAKELERLADQAFGLATQQVFYDELLDRPEIVVDLFTQGAPKWSRPIVRAVLPLLRHGIRRQYRISPDVVRAAKERYARAFDETDRLLAETGGPFLLGERITRLDLTVAALLGPSVRPPEHLVRWPSESDVPPSLVDFLRPFESRPTWQLAARLYREHRRAPAERRT